MNYRDETFVKRRVADARREVRCLVKIVRVEMVEGEPSEEVAAQCAAWRDAPQPRRSPLDDEWSLLGLEHRHVLNDSPTLESGDLTGNQRSQRALTFDPIP